MRKSELHNYLLKLLNTQAEMGLDSLNSFVLNKVTYCHEAMVSLIGISSYLVNKVVEEHQRGFNQFYHGNRGIFYHREKRDRAIAYIDSFSKIHCENLPDRDVRRLPSYMNIGTIFLNYTENVPEALQLNVRSFYGVFETYFGNKYRRPLDLPRITFQPRHSHPICSECALLQSLCQRAKSESELLYAEKRKRAHMDEVRKKYLKVCERKELAIQFPEDYLFLTFDDLDQAKIKSPYTLKNTKECAGMLRLNNHCTGLIAYSGKLENDRIVFAYLNNDQYPQGGVSETKLKVH